MRLFVRHSSSAVNGAPVRKRRRPSLEPLEGRQLLSYTFSLVGTTATATGDAQSDKLTIGAQGGLLFYSVNGSTPSFDWSGGAGGLPGFLLATSSSVVNIDQGTGTDAINLVSSSVEGASLGDTFFNVLAGGPADSLQVDDSADVTPTNTYDLTGSTISGPGILVSLSPAPLGGGIALLGGTGGNQINIDSTDAGQPVSVVANGNDSVSVGAGALLGVINSAVTVSGPANSVNLTVDGSRNDGPQTLSLAGNADGTSTLSGVGSGTLTATTASLKSYSILGGVSNDTLNVDTSTANPIPAGGLAFDGGTQTDTLNVNAGGRGVNVSTPGVVALAGLPPINYTNVEAVNVTNAADPPLTPVAQTVSATEGTPLNQVDVASFTDADPSGQPGNFTAQIAWGDGAVSAGTVVASSSGGFNVLGSHTYIKAGIYTLVATVADNGNTAVSTVGGVPVSVTDPGGAATTVQSSAQIADAPLSAQGLAIAAVEGAPFNGTVATFTDADPNAAASYYTVTIDWGVTDANGAEVVTPGIVAPDGSGGFTVSGSNTYPEEGTFPIKVTIADFGGATAIANGTANVADAPLSAHGLTIATTEGLPFSGAVATFTDADPNGTVADYTATIDWGLKDANGAEVITPGTVAPNPAGGFVVNGMNTYPEEGTFPITVTIRDAGGASAVANSTAQVADAPLSAQGVTVAPTPGQSFTGVVATFTDANPNAVASEFSATIDWGVKDANGTEVVTSGTIAAAAGGFTVSGTNTYLAAGTFAITVTIHDVGGASAVANSTADVGVKPFRLVVTTTVDLVNGVPADGSLRANILAANAHPGADTIIFDIVPRAGVEDIRLDAPLPPITDPVTLDATTQPGYAGQPIVMVNGSATTGDGLTFNVGNSTVRGLVISGFAGAGIRLAAGGGDLIQNDVIGTDASGQTAFGNGVGILVDAGAGTTIGGTAAGAGNTISGNLTAGVYVNGPASATEIVGNRIGTNPAGTAAVVRGGVTDPLQALQNTGVVVVNSGGNSVHGNVVSGNYVGVMLAGNGPGGANVLQGNLIGTDASGTVALGNIVGVYINGSAGNLIGGTSPGTGNTVSGNSSVGIEVLGSASTGNQVEGNLIGLAADGRGTLGNANGTFVQPTGVFIQGASGNVIGGASPGAGNTITGNQSAGVFILSRDGTASGNVVQGDFIGLGPGGTSGPGNTGYGVLLYNAPGNQVVGAGASATRFGRNGLGNVQVFNGPLPASSGVSTAPVIGKSSRKASAHRPVRHHPIGPLHRHRKPRAAR